MGGTTSLSFRVILFNCNLFSERKYKRLKIHRKTTHPNGSRQIMHVYPNIAQLNRMNRLEPFLFAKFLSDLMFLLVEFIFFCRYIFQVYNKDHSMVNQSSPRLGKLSLECWVSTVVCLQVFRQMKFNSTFTFLGLDVFLIFSVVHFVWK